ncbi:MAG: diaminopimelate epimerase [Oscillospiraceae bacterium]
MRFTKMHGIGNDYIYFDCMKTPLENPEELAIKLSDRHKGVGGDGIVMILPSETADFRMRMFNADGSEGNMCGNATRCIGKFVYERGLTDKTELTLETRSGIKYLTLTVEDGNVRSVTVDMGIAEFQPEKIPVLYDGPAMVDAPISVDGRFCRITAVSMGNPHCVLFTDEVSQLSLEQIGPSFENLSIFPDRVNTEFVHKISDSVFEMRVWERGSGETMACGTGACAVAAAAVRLGLAKVNSDITIQLRGGDLHIVVCESGKVLMTGPAEFVFEGELIV